MDSKIGREFVPGVCCPHRWTGFDHPEWSEQCLDCPAVCNRDRDGVIEEFDAARPAPPRTA